MNDPLISVIIPVYKTESYLTRCVNSVRNQTYTNLEIILVDDGSPDRSGELCDALAAEDSRIRVVHKKNGGLSSARNAGLDIMTGDYVSFVDSDDWIEEDMIRTLYKLGIQNETQIACCGISITDGEKVLYNYNSNLEEQFVVNREEAMVELNKNYRITNSVCDKLYQTKLFHGLRLKEGVLYEDAQIQPFLLHRAEKIVYIAKPMYCYFQSQGSILRGEFSLRQYDCMLALKERIAFFQEKYPFAVAGAKALYLQQSLHFIYKSYGNQQWDCLRAEMIQEVRRMPDKDVIRCMPLKIRAKRLLCCVSLKGYIKMMDWHCRKRG